MNLEQLQFERKSCRVLVGGVEVVLHEVPAADDRVVDRTYPRPEPPTKKDPNGGSLSRKPDPYDANHLRAFNEWWSVRLVMRLAIAMGLQIHGRGWDRHAPEADRQTWLREASDALCERLSEESLLALQKAYDAMVAGEEALGLGNSGPGLDPGPS